MLDILGNIFLMFSVLFQRIREVGAVLPRCFVTAEYPPERGSEGCWACGCHTQKFCLSIRQRHVNLHSMYTFSLFSRLLYMCFGVTILHLKCKLGIIYWAASFLRLRGCQLEKIVQSQLQEQRVSCRIVVVLVILLNLMDFLSLCPFVLMWHIFFILSSSCQRHSTEQMDSAESPGHQTSAHVCYGQYNVHVMYFYILFGTFCLIQSSLFLIILLFLEMASVNTTVTICGHCRVKELQNQPSAKSGGETCTLFQFYNVFKELFSVCKSVWKCFTNIWYYYTNIILI